MILIWILDNGYLVNNTGNILICYHSIIRDRGVTLLHCFFAIDSLLIIIKLHRHNGIID